MECSTAEVMSSEERRGKETPHMVEKDGWRTGLRGGGVHCETESMTRGRDA